MKPLYEFDEDLQLTLIGRHLQKHGQLLRRTEGAFADVFTFETGAYPTHLVAKCPKIRRFGNIEKAREGLAKLIDELDKTMKYYRHPSVHRFGGVEIVHGWPFLISRLRSGTLSDLIAEPSRWDLATKLTCVIQIAHTTNYCRKIGLIAHQDFKPGNIFFDIIREKFNIEEDYVDIDYQMYVADFGIADAFRDFGRNAGSRPYMAPEQYAKGIIQDGSRIDVFALAVIMFECLTDGLHPIGVLTADVWPVRLPDKPRKWDHENVWRGWARSGKEEVSARLTNCRPPELAELVSRSLSAESDQRPSMDEFESTLWQVLENLAPDKAAAVRKQIRYFDSLTEGPESRWPYMEQRLKELREFYARWDHG